MIRWMLDEWMDMWMDVLLTSRGYETMREFISFTRTTYCNTIVRLFILMNKYRLFLVKFMVWLMFLLIFLLIFLVMFLIQLYQVRVLGSLSSLSLWGFVWKLICMEPPTNSSWILEVWHLPIPSLWHLMDHPILYWNSGNNTLSNYTLYNLKEFHTIR